MFRQIDGLRFVGMVESPIESGDESGFRTDMVYSAELANYTHPERPKGMDIAFEFYWLPLAKMDQMHLKPHGMDDLVWEKGHGAPSREYLLAPPEGAAWIQRLVSIPILRKLPPVSRSTRARILVLLHDLSILMLGELSALFTAVMWSGTSIAFSEASVRIGALQVNINRLFIAMLFLFATITIAGFPFDLSAPQVGYLAISGLVGFIFGDTFLFRAFKEIGPRLGMLLMSLVPAIAAIQAYIFLGEVLDIIDVAGMTLTIAGIAIVILERAPAGNGTFSFTRMGLLYGLLGALGQATGLILAKAAFDYGPMNGFTATFVRVTAAFVVFLPLGILLKWYKNPVPLFRKNPKALLFITIGSFTGPFLGVTGSLIAIAHTQIGVASTIMALPPIIMLPMIRIIYKEHLSVKAIGGALLAVAGVAALFLA